MAVQARLWLQLGLGLAGVVTVPVNDLAAQRFGAQQRVGEHFKSGFQVGVGWVANVPTSYLGFSLMTIAPSILGGAGLYADVKLTTDSPKNAVGYVPGLSVLDAEVTFADRLFGTDNDWFTIDLALVYAVAPELVLYAGTGYSDRGHYREYFDETETRGNFGFYWIDDPSRSGARVNLLGGVIMRLNQYIAFQGGGQTQPAGANVGVVLRLIR